MIVLRRVNNEGLHLLGELHALARVYRSADGQRVTRDYGHHVGAGVGVGVRPAKMSRGVKHGCVSKGCRLP